MVNKQRKLISGYSWGTNEETFNGGIFATEQEAIDDANSDLMPGDTFYVGEARTPDIAEVVDDADAERLIESILDRNHEEFGGDWAEFWCAHIMQNSKAHADLAERLRPVLRQWVKAHDLAPSFYNVTNAKQFKVEAPHE